MTSGVSRTDPDPFYLTHRRFISSSRPGRLIAIPMIRTGRRIAARTLTGWERPSCQSCLICPELALPPYLRVMLSSEI